MKRQLPQWMMGVPSNHQKNNTGDSNINIPDERVERETMELKKRKQSSHNNRSKYINCGVVERERKGVKNKSDRMAAKLKEKAIENENKETIEPIDCVKGKPPRSLLVKCKERKRTREKEHVRIKNGGDVASTECLDDEDLTLEDLMDIANEYIQEDNTSNQVQLSKEKHMLVNKSHGIVDSHSSHPTTGVNSFESNMSANPTQSMLDVFLGPLLKKTQEENKRVKSKTSDHLDIKFESYKQKSIPAEEKPVTTTLGKKKSSLKDKVMMFLD